MKKSQQLKEMAQYRSKPINNLTESQYFKIVNAAADGCALHQLYLDDQISEAHFHAGLAFAKLYTLAMRSFGIHNRVKTASQTWDQLYGVAYDSFSSKRMEGIWRYILKALDPLYHNGLPMREIAFELVLTNSPSKQLTLTSVKKTLEYLQTIWEKIEEGPYRLGLFAYHKNRVYSQFN